MYEATRSPELPEYGSKEESGPRRLSGWSYVSSEATVRDWPDAEMKCA